MAPELVCATWQVASMSPELGTYVKRCDPQIEHWSQCEPIFRRWLSSGDLLVGHNVAYDFCVVGAQFPELVPAIFEAYDADRVTDTMLREKLLDIAGGCFRGKPGADGTWRKTNYKLFDLTAKYAKRLLDKDTWRMFYGEFRDVPLTQWPAHALVVKEKYRPDLQRLEAEFAANPKTFSDKETLGHLRGMIGSDPGEVVRYPLDDATSTLDCFIPQERHAEFLEDQFRQARKDFWLHLASTWGLRTNAPGVERLQRETERERDEVRGALVAAGLVRPDGSRDTKAATAHMLAVCKAKGIAPRLTDGGAKDCQGLDPDRALEVLASKLKGVSLDEDSCEATGDALLEAYATFAKLGTILSKDVPALASGTVFPIHTHFGLAETGRTTSSGPNVQNWGKKGGARECFEPRRGFIYAVGDVDQLELRTLAQVCIVKLGKSRLAEVLNAGMDPHTAFACNVIGIPYEEGMRLKDANDPAFDDVRQVTKFTNFALPGGVGPAKMVVIAESAGRENGKYKIDLSLNTGPAEEQAGLKYYEARFSRKPRGGEYFGESLTPDEVRAKLDALSQYTIRATGKAIGLKAAWFAQWPEMREYFEFVDSLEDETTGRYNIEQLYTGRYRGGAKYPAACNTWFQGLGADGAGEAGWLIAKACYVDRVSPLFGARTVNHSHDDFVEEVRDDSHAHDAAEELARLMVRGFGKYTPDVPIKVKPHLTRVWTKKAKPVFDANGRLTPWPAVAA